MGLGLYGIIAAQNPDNIGETILIEGLDDSKLKVIKDEHPEQENFFHTIGTIRKTKKIFSEKDCEDDRQRRCWRLAQVPFLYGEGELADDTEHPNAKAAAAMLKFSKRPDVPLDIGFSVDGGIIERRTVSGQPTEDENTGKVLARSIGTAASLTVKPCNPKCVTFLTNDLTKSDMIMQPPVGYIAALQKSRASRSFRNTMHNDVKLLLGVERLKKSLTDYFGAFTSLQCKQCGKALRFFKGNSDIPNRCSHCGSHFSLNNIWQALNK
jgi:hypothetical protein